MRRWVRGVILGAAVVLTLDCRARRPVETTPEVPPRGLVGMKFLPAPPGPQTAGQRFVPPKPRGELEPPGYPPTALAAGASPFLVVVRITIDAQDGRVIAVEESPLMPSSSGPFAREFRIAAERAVRLWRFTPGRMETIDDWPDADGDGAPDALRVVESVGVPVFYDVSFDFEIVAGEATVSSSVRDP